MVFGKQRDYGSVCDIGIARKLSINFDGSETFITNGQHCDRVIVVA